MADFDSIEAQIEDIVDKLGALELKVEAEKLISRVCTTCGGDGYLDVWDDAEGSPAQVPCPLCGGAEKIDWGFQEAL
jgi:hypothetical protein